MDRLFSAVICILVAMPAAAAGRAASVVVDPVIDMELNETRRLVGRVVAHEGGVVAAEISGPVQDVLIKVGDQVKEDQALLQIDPDRLQLQLNIANAQLQAASAAHRSAEVDVESAELKYQRQAKLSGTTAFSKANYDDLKNELSAAKADLQAADAKLQEKQAEFAVAKLNLERATIRAPYNGIITEKIAQPGMYVNPGMALLEMVNQQGLEVELDVPINQLPAIKKVNMVQIERDSKQIFSAQSRSIILEENVGSRTITVRLIPDSAVTDLIVNESVTALIPIAAKISVPTVHKDALMRKGPGFMVYVVQNKKALPRPISIGRSVESRVEVLTGLEKDELVVVRGNERLHPQQPVEFRLMTQ